MKRKRILLISVFTICIAISLVLLPSCAKGKKSEEASAIKIGAILPMTGSTAEYGDSNKKGASIYIEEQKNQGLFSVTFNDSKNDNKTAKNLFTRLESKGFDFYFISMSGIAMTLKPDFKDFKNFMISIAAAKDLTERGYGIIKMLPDTQNQANEIVGVIKKLYSEDVNKCLIYINDDFGLSFKKIISDEIKDIKTFDFSKDEKEFKNIVSKVLIEKPKTIITIGYGTKLGLLIKTIRVLGFEDEIIATPEVMFDDVKNVAGDALKNVITVTFNLREDDKDYIDFTKRYNEKYSKNPNYDSFLGYDCIKIIVEGLKELKNENKELTPKKLFEHLTAKKYFRTFLGDITIEEDGRAFYTLAIKKNINGEWVNYK